MKKNNDLHILIVDDEKLNIELAAAYLKEDAYKLSFALNAKSAVESALTKDINLILLDINMPETDGFEVCEILKADVKTKNIPIVFLTAQTDIEYISRAFEVGGVDYINKPFNGIELKVRVKTHLQNMLYLEDIKKKQSKLAQLSITDPLTKLNNSFFFDSQLQSRLNHSKKFWVVYVKINNFEKINNFYGFDKANILLKLFGQLLKEVSFKNALVARLHGTSFGILIKDYEKKNIKELASSLAMKFLQHKELKKNVNFSIVAMRVKEHISIPNIYRELQNTIKIASDNRTYNILFIE
ncbi:MAG: response regulator [Campylobacterota bacterium]|nr:response regulator [Campylobacterota bacterium]